MSGASDRVNKIILELNVTGNGKALQNLVTDLGKFKKQVDDMVKSVQGATGQLDKLGATMENSMRRAFMGPKLANFKNTSIIGGFKQQFSSIGTDIKKSIEAGMLSMGNLNVNSQVVDVLAKALINLREKAENSALTKSRTKSGTKSESKKFKPSDTIDNLYGDIIAEQKGQLQSTIARKKLASDAMRQIRTDIYENALAEQQSYSQGVTSKSKANKKMASAIMKQINKDANDQYLDIIAEQKTIQTQTQARLKKPKEINDLWQGLLKERDIKIDKENPWIRQEAKRYLMEVDATKQLELSLKESDKQVNIAAKITQNKRKKDIEYNQWWAKTLSTKFDKPRVQFETIIDSVNPNSGLNNVLRDNNYTQGYYEQFVKDGPNEIAWIKKASAFIKEKEKFEQDFNKDYNKILKDEANQEKLKAGISFGVRSADKFRLKQEVDYQKEIISQAKLKAQVIKNVGNAYGLIQKKENAFQNEKETIKAETKARKEQKIQNVEDSFSELYKSLIPPIQTLSLAEAGINLISTVMEHAKLIFAGATMAAGAFFATMIGGGLALKSWASDIILTTERMRSYNIALLGMFKTQTNVDKLMASSMKVTAEMPVAYEQVFEATKAMSLISPLRPMLMDSKNMEGTLKDVWKIIIGLSSIEPEWGIKGAMFSLREALSGDLLSLKRRFELPVDTFRTDQGEKLSDVKYDRKKMIATLSREMENLVPKESLLAMSNQFGFVLTKLEGVYIQFKQKIGESGIYQVVVDDFKKVFEYLNTYINSFNFEVFASRISNAFVKMWSGLKDSISAGGNFIAQVFGIDLIGNGSENIIASAMEKYVSIIQGGIRVLNDSRVQNYFKNLLKDGKEFFMVVYTAASNLFSDVISDINKLTGHSGKLKNSLEWLISNRNVNKGMFYLWFFGPQNIGLMIIALINSCWALFKVLKAISGLMPFGSLIAGAEKLSKAIGLTKLGLGVAVVGLVVGIDIVINSFTKLYEYWDSMNIWNTGLGRAIDEIKSFLKLDTSDIFKYEQSPLVKDVENYKKITKIAGIDEKDTYNASDFINRTRMENDSDAGGMAAFDKKLEDQKKLALKAFNSTQAINEKATWGLRGMPSPIFGNLDVDSTFENLKKIDAETVKLSDKLFIRYQVAQKNAAESLTGDTGDVLSMERARTVSSAINLATDAYLKLNGATDDATSSMKTLNIEYGAYNDNLTRILSNKTPEKLKGMSEENIQKFVASKAFLDTVTGGNSILTSGVGAVGHAPGSKHGTNEAFDLVPGGKFNKDFANSEEFINSLFELRNKGISKILLEEKAGNGFWNQELIKKLGNDFIRFSDKYATGTHLHFETLGKINTSSNELMKAISEDLNGTPETDNPEWKAVGTAYQNEMTRWIGSANDIGENIKLTARQLNSLNKQAFDATLHFNVAESPVNQAESGQIEGRAMIEALRTRSESFISSIKEFDGLKIVQKEVAEIINQGSDNLIHHFLDTKGTGPIEMIKSAISTAKDVWEKIGIQEKQSNDREKIERIEVEKRVDYYSKAYSMNKLRSLSDDTFKQLNTTKRTAVFEGDWFRENISDMTTALEKFYMDAHSNVPLEMAQAFQMFNDEILLNKKNIDEAAQSTKEFYAIKATEQSGFVIGKSLGASANTLGIPDMSLIVDIQKKGMEQIAFVKNEIEDKLKSGGYDSVFIHFTSDMAQFSKEIELMPWTRMNDLLAWRVNLNKLDHATRTKYFSAVETGLEKAPQGSMESLQMGMASAASEWKNTSEIMFETGKSWANDMSSTLQTNFFDTFTGKVKGIGDFFKNVFGSMKDMVLQLISKLLAMSVMKIVLGVDVNSSNPMGGGSGGLLGGLLGMFGGGNKGGSGGNGPLGIVGKFLGMGGRSNQSIGSIVGAGMSRVGDVGGVGLPGMDFSKYLPAIAATKVSSGGILSKATAWLKANPLLGAGIVGAGMFLSQPGRLFGGTVDHTSEAKASYATYNDQLAGYNARRADDREKYAMSTTSAKLLAQYQFGGISYTEHKSGDGIFSKKTKTGETDATAFLNSMKGYYTLLQLSAEEHYDNLHKIDKLKETNELAAVKMEENIKTNYFQELNAMYQLALSKGDWAEADKLRDKVFSSMDDLYKLNQQEKKLIEDTGYKKREYEALKTGNQTTYDQEMLNILIDQSKKFTVGTIEWYDAQIGIMEKQKGIADKIKEIADTITSEFNGMKLKIISDFKNLVSYDKNGNFISTMKNYNPENTLASGYMNKFSVLYKDKLALQNGTFLDKYKTMTQVHSLVATGTNSTGTIGINATGPFNIPSGIRTNKVVAPQFKPGSDMTTYNTGQNMAIMQGWINNKPLTEEMFNNITNKNYDAFIEGMLTESQRTTATGFGFKTNKEKFDALFSGLGVATENIWNTADDAIKEIDLSITQLTQQAGNQSKRLENAYNKDNLFTPINKLQDDIINNLLQRIASNVKETEKELAGSKNPQYLLDLDTSLNELNAESNDIVKSMADQMKEWIASGIASKSFETDKMWDLPLLELSKKFNEIAIRVQGYKFEMGILESSKDSKKEDVYATIKSIRDSSNGHPNMSAGLTSLQDVSRSYDIYKDPYEAFYQGQKANLLRQLDNNENNTDAYWAAFNGLYNLETEHILKGQEKVKLLDDTRFAKMEYEAFRDFGTSEIEYARQMLNISQLKTATIPRDTIEWYNAQTDIIQKQRDLTIKVRGIIEATIAGIDGSIKESYDFKNFVPFQRKAYSDYLANLYTQKEQMQLYGRTTGVDYTKEIADKDKEIEITKLIGKNTDTFSGISYRRANRFSTPEKIQQDTYANIDSRMQEAWNDYSQATAKDLSNLDNQKSAESMKEIWLSVVGEGEDAAKGMAEQLSGWMKEGLITKSDIDTIHWGDPLVAIDGQFQRIAQNVREFKFKNTLLETFKDLDKESLNKNVIGETINNLMAISNPRISDAQNVLREANISTTNPYEQWYTNETNSIIRQMEVIGSESDQYWTLWGELTKIEIDHVQKGLAEAKLLKDTDYARQDYNLFVNSGGNDLAYSRGTLDILNQKAQDEVAGTIAWYDIHKNIVQQERDIADKVLQITTDANEAFNSSSLNILKTKEVSSSYKLAYINTMKALYDEKQNLELNGGSKEDILALTKNIEVKNLQWEVVTKTNLNRYNKDNLFSSPEKLKADSINSLLAQKSLVTTKYFESSDDKARTELQILLADINGEIIKMTQDLATQVQGWANEGVITKFQMARINWNAPLDALNAQFEAIALDIRKTQFKGGAFSLFKGFSDDKTIGGLTANTQVQNIINEALGMNVSKKGTGLSMGGTEMTNILNTVNSGTDPFEAWYNFSLDSVKNKIENATEGSTAYFDAFNELMGLLSEKADHAKQVADKAMSSVEEMLGKIEETMKMRIAEERKSNRGDAYFIDVGSSKDSAKMLDNLLSAVHTNDPAAMKLIEDFKKKMLGISR